MCHPTKSLCCSDGCASPHFERLFPCSLSCHGLLQILLCWSTFDVAVVDQLSVGHILLRLKARKILFYCHFPDLHLSKRTSLLKRLYRVPFDWLERVTTGNAWLSCRFR
jgi:hypothetical protein